MPFATWVDQCREVDILVSSTAAETHLLSSALLVPFLRERADRPLFIIDIAVPRNVAPEVNELDGVYLYDMDSLREIAAGSRELRGSNWPLQKRSLTSMSSIFRNIWVCLRLRGKEPATAQGVSAERCRRPACSDAL